MNFPLALLLTAIPAPIAALLPRTLRRAAYTHFTVGVSRSLLDADRDSTTRAPVGAVAGAAEPVTAPDGSAVHIFYACSWCTKPVTTYGAFCSEACAERAHDEMRGAL